MSEKFQEMLTTYKIDMDSVSAIVRDKASNGILAGEWVMVYVIWYFVSVHVDTKSYMIAFEE